LIRGKGSLQGQYGPVKSRPLKEKGVEDFIMMFE